MIPPIFPPEFLLSSGFIAVIVTMLVTALFRWLWNITMPEVFGLREIRFWQAFRLMLICGLLTSGGWWHSVYRP